MEINDGHYLELMDRLAVQANVINDYVYEHVLTHHLPLVKEKVETALTNLYEAYQLVGNEIPENQINEKEIKTDN